MTGVVHLLFAIADAAICLTQLGFDAKKNLNTEHYSESLLNIQQIGASVVVDDKEMQWMTWSKPICLISRCSPCIYLALFL